MGVEYTDDVDVLATAELKETLFVKIDVISDDFFATAGWYTIDEAGKLVTCYDVVWLASDGDTVVGVPEDSHQPHVIGDDGTPARTCESEPKDAIAVLD